MSQPGLRWIFGRRSAGMPEAADGSLETGRWEEIGQKTRTGGVGREVTVIGGSGATRCVYLTNGAALIGFTLTNGVAAAGGGVWCESPSAMVSNCTLVGNSVAGSGGGAYNGTLNNCTLTGDSAQA